MKADTPLQPAKLLSKSSTKNTIKQWSEEDRPREKLLRLGTRHLSDAELLAIFINSGTEQDTALDLAKRLMTGLNNELGRLLEIDHAYLTGCEPGEKKKRFAGLGEHAPAPYWRPSSWDADYETHHHLCALLSLVA